MFLAERVIGKRGGRESGSKKVSDEGKKQIHFALSKAHEKTKRLR